MAQHAFISPVTGLTTATPRTTNSASITLPITVVDTYHNGDSWYRKYSDGWVEQGGYVNATSVTAYGAVSPSVTFVTPFTTACLMVKCTPVHSATTTNANNDYELHVVQDVSTTGFTYRKGSGGTNLTGFYWQAKGF